MKICVAQLNALIGDPFFNAKKIVQALEFGAKCGADLVVTPELSLLGYPIRDLMSLNHLFEAQQSALNWVVEKSKDLKVAVGLGVAERRSGPGKPFFNSYFIFEGGKKIGGARKSRNPSYDIFEEDRFFESWRGDPKENWFKFKDSTIEIQICEDMWDSIQGFGIRDVRTYEKRKDPPVSESTNHLVLFPSASPFWISKHSTRLDLIRSFCQRRKVSTLFVNSCGGQDGLIFDGNSVWVDSCGEPKWHGKDFEEQTACFNFEETAQVGELQNLENTKWDSLRKSICLGIRDYFSKTCFEKAILGLSGGIDSALVAVLAAEALGTKNLSLVYLPTHLSSPLSKNICEKISGSLHIPLEVLNIDSWVDLLSSDMNLKSGLAYENLQSRCRGMALMTLANNRGALVLSTGNKSELAMGYSTLYGDMCGALMPLGDLYKTEIFGLSYHVNRRAIESKGVAPIPQECLDRPPSAELAVNQVDSDSLPPYEILDGILYDLIENQGTLRGKKEDWESLLKRYGNHNLKSIIQKFHRAEFKRWQAAPIIKVHHRSFGQGWKMPLASGILT